MYKSEIKAEINKEMNSLTVYANKESIFDVEDSSHLEILEKVGELSRRLRTGNYVNDLNGRSAIQAATDELAAGNKIKAVFIIKKETGRNIKEAKEFVETKLS